MSEKLRKSQNGPLAIRRTPGIRWGLLALGLLTLLLTGCASDPYVQSRPQAVVGKSDRGTHPVVRVALAQLDRPYRFGGRDPQGFDCSGLVYYAHQRNGIEIPRTTREQHRRAQSVSLREMAPGDLLFFRERKRKASHVGLYVGSGRFVHASTSKRTVKLSQLDDPYWKSRLLAVGRYLR